MKKNYVLAFVLIFLVLIAGNLLQRRNAGTTEQIQGQNGITATETTQPNDSLSAFVVSDTEDETDGETVALSESTYIVETNLVRAMFTNKGGDLISYKLKRHNMAGSTENVEMIDNVTDANRTFGISIGEYNAPLLDTIFSVKQDSTDDGEQIISFTGAVSIKNERGEVEKFKISKHYRFLPDEYLFELVVAIDGGENFSGLNYGGASYTIRTSPQIGPEWNKKDRYDFRRFSSLVSGKRKDLTLKAGQTKEAPADSSWTAVSGKYFTFVLIPDQLGGNTLFSTDNTNLSFQNENTQIFLSQPPMLTSSLQHRYKVYIGPTGEQYVHRYSNATKNSFGYSNLGLDTLASSSGVLSPIIFVVKNLLQFVYRLVKNWGVAIIIVTVLIKLIMVPISIKSMVGTQKLQPYQGRITEIQQKYRTNPQKMQEELNKIYTTAGYRPGCASGCLPIVVTFAVLIAMFQLFNNYFEFRNAVFIPGWISDLSVGDSIYTLKNPIPFLNWTEIRLLPLIYVGTQYLTTLITRQTPQNQQMQSMMFFMMYIMPALFFFMLYDAPSGLFVYWITSNILVIFQQCITNAIVKKETAK